MGIGEQPASSIFQEIHDIELDGIMGNEQVIIEGSTDPLGSSYTVFTIQRFDTSLQGWCTEYVWSIQKIAETDIENAIWNITGTPVVLLKLYNGNNGGLSYRVLGYQNGSFAELIARDNIGQRNVFFYGNCIIEQAGRDYFVWTKEEGALILIPY